MILAVDIGNSNIVIGGIHDDTIVFEARLRTDATKTSDEYCVDIKMILDIYRVSRDTIEGSIVSSVVPQVLNSVKTALLKLTGKNCLVVGPGLKTGLNIRIENPAQTGADLVVGAVAALKLHKPPLILIDMGTATTMTVIDREARVLGGAIIPGVGISLEALANGTSQLPHISLDAPKKCISSDTVEAMRSGSVYGTAAMLDGMIERMEAELGEPAAVIATGGLSGCIIPYCRREITYDKNLLLNGLWALYQKNKRKR